MFIMNKKTEVKKESMETDEKYDSKQTKRLK